MSLDSTGVSGIGDCVFCASQKDSSAPFKTELIVFIIYYIQFRCKLKCSKENVYKQLIYFETPYVLIVLEKGWLQHVIYLTSPFYFSILFHMITSYMKSSFTTCPCLWLYTSLFAPKQAFCFFQAVCLKISISTQH